MRLPTCDYPVTPALVLMQTDGVNPDEVNRAETTRGDTGLLSLVTLVDKVHLRHLRRLGNRAVAA